MALGNHLSITLPDNGAFRDSLLAQRSRIFDGLWPMSQASEAAEPGAMGPTLEWGIGSGHSRAFHRSGPVFPYGTDEAGYQTRSWLLNSQARFTRPFSLRGQHGSLGAYAHLSPARTSPDYELAMQADLLDVFAENLSVSGSAGIRKITGSGYVSCLSLASSRLWPFEKGSLSVYGGYGGEWEGTGRSASGNFWSGITREVYLAGENTLAFSLEGTVQRWDAQADRLEAPVLYVDDVAKASPTHFRSPDFRDTLPKADGAGFLRDAMHAAARPLSLQAPQTYFSISPSLTCGFTLPAGWQAYAGVHYGVDLYPEYAWDHVPGPDSLEPFYGDFNGLALNRADGHLYAAVLVHEGGGVGEYYGSEPLEHRAQRRMDQRAGADFNLVRYLPDGNTLALGLAGELAWSNLPGSAPAESQPWQWGVTCSWNRSWGWP